VDRKNNARIRYAELVFLHLMGSTGVTPTFYIIKFCQARSALGCILEKISLRKRFSQFNLPKGSIHGMVYCIS
jgi:hypothetical protein